MTELLTEKLCAHMDAKVILVSGYPRDQQQVEAFNTHVSTVGEWVPPGSVGTPRVSRYPQGQ